MLCEKEDGINSNLEQTWTRKVASSTCSQPLSPASGHMRNQRSRSRTVGVRPAPQQLL